MFRTIAGVAVLAAALAGCGTNREDRTTGGAGVGAATGAAVGALGGPVGALAGAAIGAGAGAITGATTSPQDVNLGRPPWDNPEVRTPLDENRRGGRAMSRSGVGTENVREAQRALNQRGFNAGSDDGMWGPQTAQAVTAFQRANNLSQTGRLDAATMQALDIRHGNVSTAQARRDRNGAYMGGGMVGTPGNTGSTTGTTGGTGTPSTPPAMNNPGGPANEGRTGP